MIIHRKRVISPQRYLFTLRPGDRFYIATSLLDEDYARLLQYGIKNDGNAYIPVPMRSATRRNADGKWILRRDLPKEEREFVRAFHIVDWHGNDRYGTCVQHRMCYCRELLPPTSFAFLVEGNVLYSPLLCNTTETMEDVQVAMNVVLEMLGRCEIRNEERAPVLPPVKQNTVPWEILRPGTKLDDTVGEYVAKTVKHKPKAQQVAIINRHECLQQQEPEFCVIGTQNFFGYVVYGFPRINLFVFECNELNNATYAFSGDWEHASKLTKMEVLAGGLQEARIYHTEQWEDSIRQLISKHSKEVA